jgi:hypothetical protein
MHNSPFSDWKATSRKIMPPKPQFNFSVRIKRVKLELAKT